MAEKIILDEQQQAAVTTDSRDAFVLAGPGSGKTRCIVERAAYLIENQKVSPYELLLVTFTRKAAKEMRDRLEIRIGKQARKIQIGTFHAMALRLLKRFGELVGLRGSSLTVYSEFEEAYLLRDVAMDLGIYNGKSWKIPKGEIDKVFAAYYQEGIEPPEDHPCSRIFGEFNARCIENNSLTYGSLLIYMKILLPMITKYLLWKHVIVDEAHDTDRLQWGLIEDIRDFLGASLYVVADENQAIYGWRGAYPEYLLKHQAEFDVFPLTNNYRSYPEIVRAAQKLIEHNKNRIQREMAATRTDEGEFGFLRDYDSEAIARKISTWRGVEGKDLAILARNHFLLKKLSTFLDGEGVIHTYVGRTHNLMGTPLFRTYHAFLKLLVNPFDNFAFLLIREMIGVSRQQYAEIRLQATQQSKSHFQAWMHGWMQSGEEGNDFYDWFDLAKTDWNFQQSLGNMMSFPWPLEVTTVKNIIDEWMFENPNGTLADYLDWLATYDIQDEIKGEDGKLKLMTIHAAKGLEWPAVIIAGCNEGILPSKQSIEAGDVEAERRLMYVAMTRAKDSLIMAIRPEREDNGFGKVYENLPSRFVGECLEGGK